MTHALNRLTSSPLGSYTYGDSAHLHAATAAGTSSYTASYAAAGDMTCRAASGATTCAGTPTGSQFVYDAERRLKHWQNTQSSPTATDDYLYDGAGQRIQKQSVSGSTTTLMTYIGGNIEETQSVNADQVPGCARHAAGGAGGDDRHPQLSGERRAQQHERGAR